MLVISILQLIVPQNIIALVCLSAWILNLDIFSQLALRERKHDTGALIYVSENAQKNIFIVRFSLALLFALAPIVPAIIRLLSNPVVLLALLLTAVAVALCALFLAVLTRSQRPFEILMILFTYAGFQGVYILNAAIAPSSSIALHTALIGLMSVGLLLLWPRHVRDR